MLVLALVFALIGFVEYATQHAAAEPEGDRVERVRVVLPRQLALLRPEHLRALPGGGDDPRSRRWSRGRRAGATSRCSAAALAVLWAALVLTFSQSSFAALLAGLAVVAAFRWGLRLVAIVAAVVIAVGRGGRRGVRSPPRRPPEHARGEPGDGRPLEARDGRARAVDRPADPRLRLGLVPGRVQAEARPDRPNAVTASHTTPITVAAEQGLIGLALYAALVVIALQTLLTRARGSLAAGRRRRRVRRARRAHDGLRRVPRGPDDVGAAGGGRGAGRASELLDRELVVLGHLKEARVVVDDLLRAVLHHDLALV